MCAVAAAYHGWMFSLELDRPFMDSLRFRVCISEAGAPYLLVAMGRNLDNRRMPQGAPAMPTTEAKFPLDTATYEELLELYDSAEPYNASLDRGLGSLVVMDGGTSCLEERRFGDVVRRACFKAAWLDKERRRLNGVVELTVALLKIASTELEVFPGPGDVF